MREPKDVGSADVGVDILVAGKNVVPRLAMGAMGATDAGGNGGSGCGMISL